MANRRTRRRNRYVEKKNVSVRTKEELLSLLKITIIVAVIFGLAYLLTFFIVKKGVLDKGYIKQEVKEPVIDYVTASIGTVFNKSDKEYYVVFDKFSNQYENNVYLSSLLTMYENKENKLPVYKVDMNLGINEKYASDKSNKDAQKSSDLKINGVTLIKIKNGKNVAYIEDVDKIAKELGISVDK